MRMDWSPKIRAQLEWLSRRHPALTGCQWSLEDACQILIESFGAGGKLMVCGNGGSHADGEHIVGELMKSFLLPRPVPQETRDQLHQVKPQFADLADRLQQALPAVSLGVHASLMTAYANDVDASMIFAQQVYGLGCPGDVLLGLSTSGNSRNVLNAIAVAKARQIRTIAFTGLDGGAIAALADCAIRIPAVETYAVQELTIPLYHTLCMVVEEYFFGGSSCGDSP